MATGEDPTAQEGVQFATRAGRRSSQAAGQAILAAAVRSVDEALASRIENTKEWRKGYIAPFRDSVIAGTTSPKATVMIAADGLDAVQNNLSFVRAGVETSLAEAMAAPSAHPLVTVKVEGAGERARTLAIPYRGRSLSGDALRAQLDRWQAAGVMEDSATAALGQVISNPDWLDLSDSTFAVLGAASEMGPFGPLCSWGATVMALDLPRPRLWTNILDVARAGSGTVLVPVKGADTGDIAARAGIDLLTDAPEARAWLSRSDGPFTLGNYVYADGATFVRLAAAVDTLIAGILADDRNVSLAYLATPTDVYAVPEGIAEAARRGPRSPVGGALRTLTRARLYSPNYEHLVSGEDGRRWGISDSLVPIQGPNYALAKSLQRWRAVAARESGVVTSANVAPASNTTSVTKNRMLAAAYRGAPAFGVEIFEPATTRLLMAALLVHDLRAPSAAAHPDTPLDHPYDLFVEGAAHGGIWRLPHQARSILPLGLVRGLVMRK